ncbi:MAG: Transcriptional repressor NrdR [Alphaproteobacteria bacterium MarineAlpha5_Bin9]|nr:MAG: Transcriptional repressor NrdR [Alphaproteobacteria bacterium MarineAlpha5_Bin9]|tara:strand:+ start:845 stop:1309 length:465 start_codon:yes stop_codon:yes gene_type:complete
MADKIACPYCGHKSSYVKDTRESEENHAIRRRRVCEGCGSRYTTYERIQQRDLIVIKKNGQRESLDREKIFKSISLAVRKRNIEQDKIDKIINAILRKLEDSGESEVHSDLIGQHIMEALSNLDKVAYVRFASVYKDFTATKDFEDFLGNLDSK